VLDARGWEGGGDERSEGSSDGSSEPYSDSTGEPSPDHVARSASVSSSSLAGLARAVKEVRREDWRVEEGAV
jgi:hypothetical protein